MTYKDCEIVFDQKFGGHIFPWIATINGRLYGNRSRLYDKTKASVIRDAKETIDKLIK